MTGRPLAPLELGAEEEEALQSLASRRTTAQALALRARIVLACAAGEANQAVAAKLGVTPQTVGKWRARFVAQRLDGLYDEPRPGVPRSIDDAKVEAVIVATLETMPEGATHWSSRAMARQSGISTSSVQRIWRAFGLQPHRAETFKLSTDPLFVAKVRDIVGLYMSPPDHALVLCVDEKSQMQALDRTQPLLAALARPGRAAQPRLQAPWHDGAVRRPRCRHRPRARPLLQTASRQPSSGASSTPSMRPCRPISTSTMAHASRRMLPITSGICVMHMDGSVPLPASSSPGSSTSTTTVLTGAGWHGGYTIILRTCISSSIRSSAPSTSNGLKDRSDGSTASSRPRAA